MRLLALRVGARRGGAAALILGGALAAATSLACSNEPLAIDPFPIGIDLDAGVLLARGTAPEVGIQSPKVLVIDTGSPLTTIDPGGGCLSVTAPDLSPVTLTLDGLVTGGGVVPRARFTALTALTAPLCGVGLVDPGATPTGVSLVLGGDVLGSYGLRLDPTAGTINLFPDISGSNDERGDDCDAVLGGARSGGGVYELRGGVFTFTATRTVLGACLEPENLGAAGSRAPTGTDALLVLATGVEPIVLTRSAYQRTTHATDAAIDALPTKDLYVAGSPTPLRAHMTVLTHFALAANESDSRGSCAELYTSRLMALGGCALGDQCPCDQTLSCAAGASVEETSTVEVALVEDEEPLLQALRAELRPGIAEVDGLLGMDALRRFVIDVDSPNARVMLRCPHGPSAKPCTIRPRIADLDRRQQLRTLGCIVDPTTIP